MLENEIIPLYYAKNSKGYSPEWIQYVKNSIAQIAPHYTTKRMIDDYIERFYSKLAKRSQALSANGFSKAKEITDWKEDVVAHWDQIEVLSLTQDENRTNRGIQVGDDYHVEIVIDKKAMKGNVGVEAVILGTDPITGKDQIRIEPIQLVKQEGTKLLFETDIKAAETGHFRFSYRIYPENQEIPHRMDFAFVKWINK